MIPVCLLLIGDGRDKLRQATMRSWIENADNAVVEHLIEVDDRLHLMGFCGAIRYAWDRVREARGAFEYVFHLEEDWRFDRPFDVAHMARVLDTEPSIAQVALRRGGEPGEHPDGIIAGFPEDFADRETGMIGLGKPARSQEWLEHSMFWTTNPSLYRRSLPTQYQWPEAPGCEAAFTETLTTDGWRFAYWGDRDDPPWITHTGTRVGRGY